MRRRRPRTSSAGRRASPHPLDRAPRAEGLAAARCSAKGSSSLSTRARRLPGGEVEPRHERDRVLGAGRGAQPALDAQALREAQHRPVGIVGQRRGRAGADAGEAERAGVGVEVEPAERRAGRQRDRRRPARAPRDGSSRNASASRPRLRADRQEARRRRAAGAPARRPSSAARERVRIVGLDEPGERRCRSRAPRAIAFGERERPLRGPTMSCRGFARREEAHAARARRRTAAAIASGPICVDLVDARPAARSPAGRRRSGRARRSAARHARRRGTGATASRAAGGRGRPRAACAAAASARRPAAARRLAAPVGQAAAQAPQPRADIGVDRDMVAGRRDGARSGRGRGSACSR